MVFGLAGYHHTQRPAAPTSNDAKHTMWPAGVGINRDTDSWKKGMAGDTQRAMMMAISMMKPGIGWVCCTP